MASDNSDRTLALAGVWQAASLVDQIAHTGLCDSDALEASIDSVLRIDAADAAAVFGGVGGVSVGLRALIGRSQQRDESSTRLVRYVVSLLHLERRMAKRPEMLNTVRDGILDAQRQAEHFNSTHPAVIGALGNIYEQTLSTFRFRIQISGNQAHLSNTNNVSKIRALLLAGVRAAVLYRQRGGRTWTPLLRRKALTANAQQLLEDNAAP